MRTKTNAFKMILGAAAITTSAVSFTPATAHAKDRVGNGGVAFMCKGNSTTYHRNMLVDYYESIRNPGQRPEMRIGSPDDSVESLIQAYLKNVARFETDRADYYEKMARQIFTELDRLERDPTAETELVMYSDDPLKLSGDSDEVGAPAGCPKVQVVTQMEPDQIGRKLFEFYRPGWKALDNEMQVFMVFHEINLMIARARGQTESSWNARYLNSILGSTELSQNLSVCQYFDIIREKNLSLSQYLRAQFGKVTIDYSNSTTLTCHSNGNLATAKVGAVFTNGKAFPLKHMKFGKSDGEFIEAGSDYSFRTGKEKRTVLKRRPYRVAGGYLRPHAEGGYIIEKMTLILEEGVTILGDSIQPKEIGPTSIRVRIHADGRTELLY